MSETKPKVKVRWLIWSIEHDGWWMPNHRGYTKLIMSAGRYSYPEAREIIANANYGKFDRPNEAMVPDYVGEKYENETRPDVEVTD